MFPGPGRSVGRRRTRSFRGPQPQAPDRAATGRAWPGDGARGRWPGGRSPIAATETLGPVENGSYLPVPESVRKSRDKTITFGGRFPLKLVPALLCQRSQAGKPLRCQVANELRRREGRIAVRLPKGAQHAKRLGGIEIERPRQKPVRVDRFDIEPREDPGRKVGQVVGDDVLRAAADRRCQDVAVVRIRKFERSDQRFVSGDQRLRKMLAHGVPLGADTRFKMRLLFKEVQRPLVENSFGPSRPEQSGVVEAQENVSLAERKQDVGVQKGDTRVRELRQDASNS